jgi:erythromycin esterase-like protein
MAAAESMRPLTGAREDYDPLVEQADVRFFLLGEASHGTHEFYRERSLITGRLIVEAGCTAVAVEADWPDAYRVNRFVRGDSDDLTPKDALSDFRRFPSWMWRNTDVTEVVGWLREWNDGLPDGAAKVGFYGLDLYSLHASMEAVVAYLEDVDPDAAERARERYACFDHFGRDPQVYGYETGLGGVEPCEQQAVEQLVELRRAAAEVARRDGLLSEEYYRALFRGRVSSWNLRDRHMAETLGALVAHLEQTRGPTKAAVWAHNSHVGDARATALGQAGELNLGQLVRETHGADSFLTGFTTYTGMVTAASEWGGPAERKHVRAALGGSWEELFHESGVPRFLLGRTGDPGERLERAIGVIYQPETERLSHYFGARLGSQFDAILHFDETHAVEPLERTSLWEEGELPETYPWGV